MKSRTDLGRFDDVPQGPTESLELSTSQLQITYAAGHCLGHTTFRHTASGEPYCTEEQLYQFSKEILLEPKQKLERFRFVKKSRSSPRQPRPLQHAKVPLKIFRKNLPITRALEV